jgi:cysteine desulfurase
MVYLDNNATTALAPEVVACMQPYLSSAFFNPSSAYDASRGPAGAIAAARACVAQFLGGVHTDEIIFTGCATESNNAAIFGALRANRARRHIVTTAVEHPSVLEVCKEAGHEGCEVSFVGVNRRGEIDVEAFVRALRPDTLLVSVMHANNETGVIFPIMKLARIVKETNAEILFHTDATQTAGKVSLDLRGELADVDLLAFSGHKLHGPKGVGVLFARRGARIRPYLCGGHQESGRRAGTENVAYIVAMAKACELAEAAMVDENAISSLRDHLESSLCREIPWLEVNGAGAQRLPNTLNLACHCIEGESILYQLDAAGICASSGSACTSGSLEPSHVLKAMQIPFMAMHGSVRFSLSRYTTAADVEKVIEDFPGIVDRLRRISPYWDVARHAPRETACGS